MNFSKPRNSTICSRACLHVIVVVEQERDFAVPLHAGDWLDDHPFQAFGIGGSFKIGAFIATVLRMRAQS